MGSFYDGSAFGTIKNDDTVVLYLCHCVPVTFLRYAHNAQYG